jgi:hypothetical protein
MFIYASHAVECMKKYIDLLKTFLVSIYSAQYIINASFITKLQGLKKRQHAHSSGLRKVQGRFRPGLIGLFLFAGKRLVKFFLKDIVVLLYARETSKHY